MIPDEAVVSRAGSAVFSNLDGESIVLNMSSGSYYGLNELAAFVWQRLDAAPSVANIRQAILDEYDVDSDRCAQDLASLLTLLSERQLVEIKDRTDG
jgi:hypothetical protein